jgi:glutamyl-tRNA synthetase
VARADFQEYAGGEVRLKDLCNVVLGEEARFTSREVKDIPKIQWLAEGIPTEVVMPDGEVVKGLGEPNLRGAAEGDVIQFERFGFVRLDRLGEGVVAYFGHR